MSLMETKKLICEKDLYNFCLKNLKIIPLQNFERKTIYLENYHMQFYIKIINKTNMEEEVLNIIYIQIDTNDETKYKFQVFDESIIIKTNKGLLYGYNDVFKSWFNLDNHAILFDMYFEKIEVLDPIYKSVVYTNNITIDSLITDHKIKPANIILQKTPDILKDLNGPYDSLSITGDMFTYYQDPKNRNKIVYVIYKKKDTVDKKIYKLGDIYIHNIKNPTNFFKIVDFELSKNGNIFKYIQELTVVYFNKGEIMSVFMGDENFSPNLPILDTCNKAFDNLNGPFESLFKNEDKYTYYTSQENKKISHVIYKKKDTDIEKIYKLSDIFANCSRNPTRFFKIVGFELSQNNNIYKYEQEQSAQYFNKGEIMAEYMGDEIFMNIYN